jgi:fumarylacetoacetate (FAA) hydrolase family protein
MSMNAELIDIIISQRPMLEIGTGSLVGMKKDLTRANRELKKVVDISADGSIAQAIIGVNDKMLKDLELELALRN